MIEVMKAFTEGKTVQCKVVNGSNWYDCNPAWDWTNYEYRVKPEKKVPVYRRWKGRF